MTNDDIDEELYGPLGDRYKDKPQFGSAKGLITMADDFDAPLEDFKEYMK